MIAGAFAFSDVSPQAARIVAATITTDLANRVARFRIAPKYASQLAGTIGMVLEMNMRFVQGPDVLVPVTLTRRFDGLSFWLFRERSGVLHAV